MSDRKKVLQQFENQKDFINEKVTLGIEKFRKGDGEITVIDKDGKPVKNAKIKLSQKSHEFRYGANIFMLDELETTQKNELYKDYFAKSFNMATLPFYWDALEPEKGKPRYDKNSARIYRRPPIDLLIEFCAKHGIEPREHALAYEPFFPKWLSNSTVEEVKKEYERRCIEISTRYANIIPTIEVTNEMDWDKGRTAFYKSPDFVEWCFKTAEKYFPNNELAINECTRLCWDNDCIESDKYYSYVKSAILSGARVDAIGLQFHMFFNKDSEVADTKNYYNPKKLYEHLDFYATFNKPLQITEVTIPSYSWDSEDEKIQAEIIDYLYSIWFSHPAVEQIIYWNLIDGYAHVWEDDPVLISRTQGDMTIGENYYHGGLLRFDLSPKPSYYKIRELFEKRWRTEKTVETDENGNAYFRGFYGDYSVDVLLNGNEISEKISLLKNKENKFIITLN